MPSLTLQCSDSTCKVVEDSTRIVQSVTRLNAKTCALHILACIESGLSFVCFVGDTEGRKEADLGNAGHNSEL